MSQSSYKIRGTRERKKEKIKKEKKKKKVHTLVGVWSCLQIKSPCFYNGRTQTS